MAGYSQSNFAIYDWPTQLAVLKALYNTDDLHVKYIDDENEEVCINSQQELDYAFQIALNSTNNVLKLILRNSRNEIIAKKQLNIDLKKIKSLKNKQSELDMISHSKCCNSNLKSELNKSNIAFSEEQINWLEHYLENFKSNLVKEMEDKINKHIEKAICNKLDKELFSNDLVQRAYLKSADLENSARKLLSLIAESRTMRCVLKTAYLEEELQSLGAFLAEFVKDYNMPDGSKCDPNVKFQKTWLIKNTGKLNWDSSEFQVKLICIAGNINTANGLEYVNVENTKVNETASVSVELIAPSQSGNYFSEWVLSCNGFQFGPRIWCSINVNGDQHQSPLVDFQDKQLKQDLFRSNFPLTLSRISSIHGQNDFKNLIHAEDFEDEFVVVPDCFDLTKKWKPVEKAESSIKDDDLTTIDRSSECSNSTATNDLIMLNSTEITNETDSEIEIERKEIIKLMEKIDLTKNIQELKTEEPEKINKNSESSSPNKSIDIIHQEASHENTNISPNNHHQNLTNAFDLVKNAFSNLGRPSYVGPVNVANKKFELKTESNLEDLSPEGKMNKLILMGFANRSLNLRLLKKYNNNLEKVIQKLLEKNDNNWMDSR